MNEKELKGKKITVVGAARSGLAAARLLAEKGASVFLTDKGTVSEEARILLDMAGVEYESEGHTDRFLDSDFLVVSPGVPTASDILKRALQAQIPVYSEIEVASWFCQGPIVAITGSNGKTTTTSLIGHVFETAGRQTVVAGNIGFAFSDFVNEIGPETVVVLEISSFQLDYISTFKPAVSVLLNITPDHLDRYDHDFSKYAQSKARIFENQRGDDVLIYDIDDPVVREYVSVAKQEKQCRLLAISQETEVDEGAFIRNQDIVLRFDQREEVLMQVDMLALRGKHNLYNSLAAAVAARVMEVKSDLIRESLTTFQGVPHRLEFVRELDGVRYINDSKATNVNAVWYALESFQEKIVLIAGGRDKGNDYEPLRPFVREKVKGLIAIGESAPKVIDELGDLVPRHLIADSMEDAVLAARSIASPGDIVLLSPACASFDMFKSYEDRGNTFKRILASM